MIIEIVKAAAVLGGIAFVLGFLISEAASIFEVKKDPNFVLIREVLPGANCGKCGFASCDQYANAILKENAPLNKCAVGGKKAADKLAETVKGIKQ